MKAWLAIAAVQTIVTAPCIAQPAPKADSSLRFTLPNTASSEASEAMRKIAAMLQAQPKLAEPASKADWKAAHDRLERTIEPIAAAAAQATGIVSTPARLGGVPVLRIRPRNFKPGSAPLIYVHGGGYVYFSAMSSRALPALFADASGLEVVSVDYTVAPEGGFRTATDQVVSVWKALLASGLKPAAIGMMGDSAGGGLVAASVLKMRDQLLPLPGALYLISPWTDITSAGDTFATLGTLDPVLDTESLLWGADAYAAPADQRNPYASPVYGDYLKAFPPTLIQGGTRELLLSDFVREYQAIRLGHHEAILDLYEGMPHVFQTIAPNAPETRVALSRAAEFFSSHLKQSSDR